MCDVRIVFHYQYSGSSGRKRYEVGSSVKGHDSLQLGKFFAATAYSGYLVILTSEFRKRIGTNYIDSGEIVKNLAG